MAGLLAVAVCAVLVLAAQTGELAVAAVVVVAQLLLAASVFAGQALPAPRLAAVVVGGGGLLACAATLRPGPISTEPGVDSTLAGVGPAVAAVVLASLFAQMVRRDGRDRLTQALSLTVTLGVLAVLLAAWVAAARGRDGTDLIAVAAAAVGVASIALSLPGPPTLSGLIAAVAAAGAATAICIVLPDAPVWQFGAAVGLTAGLLTVAGRLLGRAWSAIPAHRLTVEALAPLSLVGPVLVVAGNLFPY